MTVILTPADLPQGSAQFIAYGPPVRVADPEGGDPITVRPQTYVRYYGEIGVKEIKEGGRSGGDTVAIHFDPASVGLSEPITGYLDPDDPVLPILKEAAEQGKHVAVALETVRKAKAKDSKEIISPLTPIHALRGAKDPSGGKASMEVAGQNIRNVIAMANGRATKIITSDPTEWRVLANNKRGDLPPEGWRFYAPGDDWTQYGAIVPSGAAPAAGPAAGAGVGVTAEEIRAIVAETLVSTLGEAPADDAGGYGRPVVKGRFNEGKKWDPRANNGQINLGSYQVGNVGWVFRWAFDHLTDLLEGETPEDEVVWALAEQVMDMSDAVQATAYGHGVEADRTAPSHTVATQWVEWAVEKHSLPFPHTGSEEVVQEWASAVTEIAAAVLAGAGQRVGDYLSNRAKAAKAKTPEPEPQAPAGPNAGLVNALLATLVRSWGNRDVIGNLGRQVKERQMEEVEIGVTVAEDGTPQFSFPPAEGAQVMALTPLLRGRWSALGAPQAAEPAQPPAEQPQVAAEPAPQQAPAAQAPAQASQDANHGYTDTVAGVVRALYGAKDIESLGALYERAKADNLLGESIWVKPSPTTGLEYGGKEQPGFTKRTVAQAMSHLNGFLRAASQPNAEDVAPAEGQASAPTPQPEPVSEESAPEPEPEPTAAAPSAVDDEAQAAADAMVVKAEEAVAAKDVSVIDALLAEANTKGLSEVKVSDGQRVGTLRAFLNNRRKRAAK